MQISRVSHHSPHSFEAARGMTPSTLSALCFSRVCFAEESLRVDLPSMRSVKLNTYAFGEVVDATVHSTLLLFDHPIDAGCLESWLYHPMSLKAKCACLQPTQNTKVSISSVSKERRTSAPFHVSSIRIQPHNPPPFPHTEDT